MQVGLTINGRERQFDVPPHRTLADLLRGDESLTALKLACAEGTCGACTVLVDDRPVLSCLTLAAACDGADGAHDSKEAASCSSGCSRRSPKTTRFSAASARRVS